MRFFRPDLFYDPILIFEKGLFLVSLLEKYV